MDLSELHPCIRVLFHLDRTWFGVLQNSDIVPFSTSEATVSFPQHTNSLSGPPFIYIFLFEKHQHPSSSIATEDSFPKFTTFLATLSSSEYDVCPADGILMRHAFLSPVRTHFRISRPYKTKWRTI
ncbi:hypothetical protein AVEN_256114-1 [Araneus ventricosus]|uniref:Uncharacterized protein n=1 Tax=Araneus ventricosus TaxID=182803 RepID=A0A4Y2D5I1_ARAVE|nr:hypothetical protein AVEN_256114-1 [Araneus ventricosus]